MLLLSVRDLELCVLPLHLVPVPMVLYPGPVLPTSLRWSLIRDGRIPDFK